MIFSSGPSSEVKNKANTYLDSMIAKKKLPQGARLGKLSRYYLVNLAYNGIKQVEMYGLTSVGKKDVRNFGWVLLGFDNYGIGGRGGIISLTDKSIDLIKPAELYSTYIQRFEVTTNVAYYTPLTKYENVDVVSVSPSKLVIRDTHNGDTWTIKRGDKNDNLTELAEFIASKQSSQPDKHGVPAKQISWELPSLDLLDDAPQGSIKKFGIVPLKSILRSDAFTKTDQPLTFALGVNEDNTPVTVGLKMLGAVLAAGQTGSGKSTFTESTLLLSLLYRYNPDELKLVLIDPKVVQFPQYQGIPHLLRPIITETNTSREAFDWLLGEAKRRVDTPDAHHPYIVIVIDEVSDLMAVDKGYYENAFAMIAEAAKKTGIHLYMGTSRPSIDIYTDMLRQAIGGRVVFTTASEIDSITMLEKPGAEQLSGYGEMVFKPYHGSDTVKIQTPYASEEEVMRVADFWRNQGK